MNGIIDTVFTREFLGTFITFLLMALCAGSVMFIIAAYFVKLRRLEKQIDEFKRDISARLDNFEASTQKDFARERHMINESLQGISETVARAVISVSEDKKD